MSVHGLTEPQIRTTLAIVVAHHRFSVEFACPSCEALGKIKVTEDAGPPFTDRPRRTYDADPETFLLLVGEKRPVIRCVACGAAFPRPL